MSHIVPSTLTPLDSPWTSRAKPIRRKYKPVDRKVRPVPTYMPNPSAQVYKPIPNPTLMSLPHDPPHIDDLCYTSRLSRERLNQILSTIPSDFLRPREIDLLAFVLVNRRQAIAFTDAECGFFSRDYYPDYEIPVIEHVPWQQPPMKPPKALEAVIYKMLLEQEQAGKYEPSSSSYRSRIFVVSKKN
ncbi:hypothetical protein K474DRAFT_1609608, partial [Panus rudis PR-1116 ss-1]